MSRHHDAARHVAKTKRIRPTIAATLPAPCAECGLPVYPEQRWHVAHVVPAALGGDTTLDNCRPAHVRCNTSAGAKLGNALTKRSRDSAGGIRAW